MRYHPHAHCDGGCGPYIHQLLVPADFSREPPGTRDILRQLPRIRFQDLAAIKIF